MPGDSEEWGNGEPGEAGASALDDLESALEAEVKAKREAEEKAKRACGPIIGTGGFCADARPQAGAPRIQDRHPLLLLGRARHAASG